MMSVVVGGVIVCVCRLRDVDLLVGFIDDVGFTFSLDGLDDV